MVVTVGELKKKSRSNKCLVKIKYMHSIQNKGAINYLLNIVSGYSKQDIIFFYIKYPGDKSNDTIDTILDSCQNIIKIFLGW